MSIYNTGGDREREEPGAPGGGMLLQQLNDNGASFTKTLNTYKQTKTIQFDNNLSWSIY